MKEIKKIVLATDFSKASQCAVEYAKTLSTQLGATLEVVHIFNERVVNIPSAYCFMPGAADWMDDYIAQNKKRGQETLSKLCEDLGGCKGHFLEGAPGQEIVAFVNSNDVDLLVMGTHGYNALMRVVMGSVAEYVLHHVKCPVFTVKQPEE